MGRRKGDTPQKAALRQLMQGYLKDNDISVKNGTDVNAIMRDMREYPKVCVNLQTDVR